MDEVCVQQRKWPEDGVESCAQTVMPFVSRLSLLSQPSGHPAGQHHLSSHRENLRADPDAGELNECVLSKMLI